MNEDKNMAFASKLNTFYNALLFACMLFAVQATASAQIIFQDDFESGDLSRTQNGAGWDSGAYTSVSSANPRTGSYSLEFNFAGVPDGQDSWAEQRFNLGGNYPEVWVKYDLFIPSNYYQRNQGGSSSNNKLFVHLWTDTTNGVASYGGTDGIAGGFEVWSSGDGFGNVSFHPIRPEMGHIMDVKRNTRGIEAADLGNWIEIVIQVRAGTTGSTAFAQGGAVNVWKTSANGTTRLIYSLEPTSVNLDAWQQTISFLSSPDGRNYFNRGYLLGWANSGFLQNTRLYIDNVIFADTPLINLDPPSSPSPTP